MAVKCLACGLQGGLHKPECVANSPAHLVGQGAQYVGQKSGWKCDRCGYENPVVPTQNGPGVTFAAVTQLEGEPAGTPHCNQCYVRMIRQFCGKMVFADPKENHVNGSIPNS